MPYLLSKYSKREGPYIACADKECGYRREAPDSDGEEVGGNSVPPAA